VVVRRKCPRWKRPGRISYSQEQSHKPVKRAARLGVHVDAAEYHWVNRIPSAAMRSTAPGSCVGWPKTDKSPQPRSSATNITIFGRVTRLGSPEATPTNVIQQICIHIWYFMLFTTERISLWYQTQTNTACTSIFGKIADLVASDRPYFHFRLEINDQSLFTFFYDAGISSRRGFSDDFDQRCAVIRNLSKRTIHISSQFIPTDFTGSTLKFRAGFLWRRDRSSWEHGQSYSPVSVVMHPKEIATVMKPGFSLTIFTARPHCSQVAMQTVEPRAVCPSVCLSVRPSRSGVLSRRMKIRSCGRTIILVSTKVETTPCPEKRCHFIFGHNFAKS